jgi:capsular exopolysaccharide synthesis family protein
MEPIDYLRILRRRWWVIAAALLIAVAAVYATTPKQVKAAPTFRSYKATHVLMQGPVAKGSTAPDLTLMAFLATTGEVPKRVAAKLNYEGEPALLAAEVTATADAKTKAIQITSTGPDRQRVAEVANAFATELMKYLDETERQKHQQALDAALEQVRTMEQRVDDVGKTLATSAKPDLVKAEFSALTGQLRSAYERYQALLFAPPPTAGLASVQLATPVPVVSGGVFRPPANRSGRLTIVGLLGLVVGAGAALVIDRIDPRLRNKEATEREFDLPVVAEVPALRWHRRRRVDVTTVSSPGSMVAETYRMLRAALLIMTAPAVAKPGHLSNGNGVADADAHGVARPFPSGGAGRPPKVILVTSSAAGEGKTTVTANLAASFAEGGNSVVVLSCNFRHPRVHRFLGAEEGAGLMDALAQLPGAPGLSDVARPTSIAGVSLITAGSHVENPAELLALGRGLVADARKLADIVLVDASPLLTVSDASELIPTADAVLVVARAGRTTAQAARRAGELLARLRAPVVGVVLVAARELPAAPRFHQRLRWWAKAMGARATERWASGLGPRGRQTPGAPRVEAPPVVDAASPGEAASGRRGVAAASVLPPAAREPQR